MKMHSMLKGLGIGLIAGAVITATVLPTDKRKLRHSKPAKALRAIGHVVEGITDSLS